LPVDRITSILQDVHQRKEAAGLGKQMEIRRNEWKGKAHDIIQDKRIIATPPVNDGRKDRTRLARDNHTQGTP
jgi:hypothetical protein